MNEIMGERMQRERRKIEQWIDVLGKEEDLGKKEEDYGKEEIQERKE